MMQDEDLLSGEEAQEYLGVSRATLWKLIGRYNVPKYKLPVRGKRVFFKRSDLDKLKEPVRQEKQERLAS